MSLLDLDISPGNSPDALYQRYLGELRSILQAVDAEERVTETQLDDDVVTALLQGDDVSVTLSEVMEIWALRTDAAEPDQLLSETRHDLMLSMSTAITNIDAVAGDLDADLSPNEIQAKLEGRLPMTLYEFAVFKQYFTDRSDAR